MSLPIFVSNTAVIDNADMSSNQTSNLLDLAEITGYAVHSVFTGSPMGTLSVKASNDGSNFVSIDDYAITTAGQRLINVEKIYYRYIKVTYTSTSGTGTLTCMVSEKRA